MKGLVLRLENTGAIGKHPLCLRYPTLALGQDLRLRGYEIGESEALITQLWCNAMFAFLRSQL